MRASQAGRSAVASLASRRAGYAVAALLAVVLACASWAWACTGIPTIVATNPPMGVPGTKVTVAGFAPEATERPVEIRWDAVDGPVLTTAPTDTFNRFSATFTVPESTPGAHTVVLVAGRSGVGRTAVDVLSSSSPNPMPADPVVDSPWTSPPPQVDESSSPGAGLMAGAALLAGGLVLGGGGVVVLALRRRARAKAE